jgi:hypothetical protein
VRMRRVPDLGLGPETIIWHSGPQQAQALLGLLKGAYTTRVMVARKSHAHDHWCFEVAAHGLERGYSCQGGVEDRHAT